MIQKARIRDKLGDDVAEVEDGSQGILLAGGEEAVRDNATFKAITEICQEDDHDEDYRNVINMEKEAKKTESI